MKCSFLICIFRLFSSVLTSTGSDILAISLEVTKGRGGEFGVIYRFSRSNQTIVTLNGLRGMASSDWQFIAIVHSSTASDISLYLNDTLKQQSNVSDGSLLFPLAGMLNYTVGSGSGSSFDGNVQDLLMFTFPLAVADVNTLARGASSLLGTLIEPQCLCGSPSVYDSTTEQCLSGSSTKNR